MEYGQLKGSLSEIREGYLCEDSTEENKRHMELRPLAVVIPDDVTDLVTGGIRTMDTMEKIYQRLLNGENDGSVPRSKVKGLRTAIREGKVETEYYL